MTDFGDQVFSASGMLTPQGIPATFGTIYFVDADNGSDGFNGLAMTATGGSGPKKTVLAAYNATTSNKHDVIVMSGVGAHAIADEIIVSKSRVHFVGLGGGSRYMGQRTRFEMGVTTGSAIAILQVTGLGNTFTNIKFRSVDTLSTSLYAVADGGELSQFTNCSFEKATDLGETTAAELLGNGDTAYYKNCTFGNGIYTPTAARQNVLFTRQTITGKVARDNIFEDCIFLSRCGSTTFVNVRATVNDLERLTLFKNCSFQAVKTSTATQDEAFGIASALTDSEIMLQDCSTQNISNIATASSGVYTNQAAGAALGGLMIEAN